MTDEEITDRVLFRMEGTRTIVLDYFKVEYYDHKDDADVKSGYVGVIRGGYQSWMDDTEDYYQGDVHYIIDSKEELESLEIGKSFTCDGDWDILVSIDYNINHTGIFEYTYEDIYNEDSE